MLEVPYYLGTKLLCKIENLKINQKIIWTGNSSDITFKLPDNLTFNDIQMLIIVGEAPATLLSSQIASLDNNGEFPLYYDNGVNIDSYANFKKISNNSARLYAYFGGSNAFRGWRSIAIIY